ncbi:MAG: UDP-2,3-diacylglucosamine diphosphatase [Rhodocyclales bacterium]|nr:UDP-2,3-diacylglucosamine diphosphatase [Rhodocyclales bacterium]
MASLFVSDLHLCPSRPQIGRLFSRFLQGPARNARALYVLGDLFEYWAGDDDLDDPFNGEVCAALRGLSESGVAVFFMAGNRDFLLGAAFARAAGLTLLAEPARLDLEGTPTLLMHGDTLCTDDAQYQAFRAQVRTADWQRSFLAQPLAERKGRIEALRRESEAQKRIKPMAIMDVNAQAVAEVLREHGCTRLIHGHTHRPAHHDLEVDGRRCERWVLADWYDRGSYLECDAAGCRTVSLA